MIIFSDALVASVGDPEADLNAPVFGYQNYVVASGVTATAAASGYPATNVANVSTASFWRSANSSLQYLTASLNTPRTVNYVGLARHNFGTAGIAVAVEVQTSLGGAWSEVVAAAIPANNNALIFRFTNQTAYGVRIKMAAGGAPPEVAVFYAGSLLVSTQKVYVGHSPITLNRRIQIVNGQSESGNYLGRIVTGSGLRTNISLTHLEPDWYRSNFDPFVLAAQTVPFFFGWRPYSYPNECGFAWLTGDPEPSNMLANGMMQVSLEMSGVA